MELRFLGVIKGPGDAFGGFFADKIYKFLVRQEALLVAVLLAVMLMGCHGTILG